MAGANEVRGLARSSNTYGLVGCCNDLTYIESEIGVHPRGV